MRNREKLVNTMEPVVRVPDVMSKFGCSKSTALRILNNTAMLHAYRIGNALVCERQYFDAFVESLNNTGGISKFSA